jgi:glycosyltransferase involved in cell wall biosynthesis
MKIVAIPPLYPPHSRVGAWLATHQFLRALAGRGHHVVVVPWLAAGGAHYNYEGVHVYPGDQRVGALRGADVVIAHSGSLGVADALDGLGHLLVMPVVRLVHGLPVAAARLDSAARVVANSHATAKVVAPLTTAPVSVIHPATDPAAYRVESSRRFVTLVNLSPDKGGMLFWRLATTMPDLAFMGVRGYYGRQVVKRLRNVEVVGPLPDIRAAYAETAVLLMPSKHESWGMTAVEAMASGIPVLAQPGVEGLAEALGAAGNFPKDSSLHAWRTALRHLLAPGPYAEACQRAADRSAQLDHEDSLTRFAVLVERIGSRR